MPLLAWLLRVLLVVVLLRIVWRFVRGVLDGASGTPSRQAKRGEPAAVPLVRDPVCGTYLPKERALRQLTGQDVHYFCSEPCRSRWLAEHAGRKAV